MSANDSRLIPLRIRLPYGSEEEFVEKYGSNVAKGGIFIATRAIKPEGTSIAFEFVLNDGSRLMRGEGTVQKVQVDEGGTRSGMTVRFTRLDARTKALIDRVVAARAGIQAAAPPDVPPDQPPVHSEPARDGDGRKHETQPPRRIDSQSSATHDSQPPRRIDPHSSAAHDSQSERSDSQPSAKRDSRPARKHDSASSTAYDSQSPGLPQRSAKDSQPPRNDSSPSAKHDSPAPQRIDPQSSAAHDLQSERSDSQSSTKRDSQPPRRIAPHSSTTHDSQSPERSGSQSSAKRDSQPPRRVDPRPSAAHDSQSETSDSYSPEKRDSQPPRRHDSQLPGRNGVSNDSQPPRRRSLPDLPAVVARPTTEEVVLGIDLGTTNSRAAVFQDGQARLVPLSSDGRTFAIPSVVAIDEKGRFLVGSRAKAQVLVDPANTVYGAKRLLGRRARSKSIRELSMRFPYKLVADPQGDAGVELRGRTYALPEISAMLLKELKESAQTMLGRKLERAVLCVPAYFNDHQRSAMLEAGNLAGLEVLRILNEPSAVALAFGYGRGLARKRILVYDLGGGTFDASVVELTGDDLEVVTTGGDNFLGGLDFDNRMAEQLSLCLAEPEREKVAASLHAVQRIRDAAEQAKIALSDADKTVVHVPFAATRDDGSPVDLHAEMTRATLEEVTEDLVERTIEVTQAVLEAGGLKPEMLDEVLLVGGQSRAPLVRRRVEEHFKRPIRADVDPHAAVAMGAAILGHAILQRERGKAGVSLSEVLSAPIGIGVKGGGLKRVLEKNTRLPAEKSITLPVKSGQAVAIALFQGPSPIAEENEYLGAVYTTPDRSGDLTLELQVGPDGTLNVGTVSPSGKRSDFTFSTADAGDDVRKALLERAPLPGEESQTGGGLLRGIKRLFGR